MYLISLGIGSPASIGYLITYGLKPAVAAVSIPGCATLSESLIGSTTLGESIIGSATLSEKQCEL